MNNLISKIEDLNSQSKYNEAAQEVAKAFNLEMKVEFLKNDFHFQGDKDKRDIYKITLKRGQREYSFNFGQSINRSGKYKGHKNFCLNSFNQYLFSESEYLKLKQKDVFAIKYNEIVLNKDFKEPNLYDVLTCLQKYEVGTFEDFCANFGYDEDSRSAEKTYKAVCKEFEAMERLFTNEELEILSLIQ